MRFPFPQLLRIHLYHAARARAVGRQIVGDAETVDIQALLVSLAHPPASCTNATACLVL